jgi:hypothetical protein
MKERKSSPRQQAGAAFLVVLLLGIISIAVITLLGPNAFESPEQAARLINFISQATCPAAVIIGVIAYYSAKG